MGWKRVGLLVMALAMAGTTFLLGLGSLRYGGPGDLFARVRAEIASQLARQPQGVSTPLPAASKGLTASALSLTLAAVRDPSPTSTSTTTPSPSPMPTSTETPTLTPTWTATSTPSPTPTRTPAHRPAAPSVALTGFTHIWQDWNNCGPASLAMNLSYWGVNLTQYEVGSGIRPNKEDKHAGADEIAAYARSQGFRALKRTNGDQGLLRLLLSNGVPVIIAGWHENEKKEGMGHYRLVTGYDDARREWILYDSLESRGVNWTEPYKGIRMAYDDLDRLWAVFNRPYIVVYPETHAERVLSIVGQEADDPVTQRASLARAGEELRQRPDDVFAWFTLGTNLLALGRSAEAAMAYDHARVLGLPYRMLWYQFGPLQAYYEVGRYDDVLALADDTLAKTTEIEELHYWKGVGLLAKGDREGARKELQRAVAQRPSYAQAVAALAEISK